MRPLLFLSLLFCLIINLAACKDSSNGTGTEEEFEPFTELIWNDEFDGDRVDYDKWTPETGNHGWGNNEWQDYTATQNTEVSDGTLKIIAKKVGNGQKVGDYTSARLNSIESFTYGRMEVRAKIPDYKGSGIWPAIWMLGESIKNGESWPECGEIDIMEYVSFNPNTFHFSVHTGAFNHKDNTQISSGGISHPSIEEEFTVFGILWEENYLKFYVEDTSKVMLEFNKPENATNDEWPFDKPQYFLLNMAVGGDWGGAQGVDDQIFPSVFEIDYVRVYK